MNPSKEYTLEDVKREAAGEIQKKELVSKRVQLVVFRLGGEEYALSIDQIKEVVHTPRIARVPHVGDHIIGVANVRGNIIAIIDLEKKFRLQSTEAAADATAEMYTLVVESKEFKVGIQVKEVPNTLTVYESDIDAASGFLQYAAVDAGSIVGIVKVEKRMIILIDIIKLIQSDNLENTNQTETTTQISATNV